MDIQAAAALRKTASELPQTAANFQFGNNEGFEYNDGLMISQVIPFPTVFGARKNLFKAQVKGYEWLKLVAENDLKSQIRTYYQQLEYLEHNAEVLARLDSIYVVFIKITELRYRTGDTKKIDISTAETKQGEIRLLYDQNEIWRKNAYESLKNLLQVTGDFSIASIGAYQPLAIDQVLDSSFATKHPQVQALYQEAHIIEQQKHVERAEGLPEFTLGYNNVSLVGPHSKNGVEKFYGRGKRFSYFDVGISIPISFGATKARVRSLDYQKQSAELAAQWQETQLQTDLSNAIRQYEQRVSQYRYFKEEALVNADELIQAALLGYRTGDISYVEYLFAVQTATDTQLNYLKSIQQVNESVSAIYSLINN
ncbi:TolC family protein [Parapedobacter defluvii]|uniref:TolC family protein n=1 Tax=Parapedobacter defluvii TaxID=2045106 RepID=UPI003340A4EA